MKYLFFSWLAVFVGSWIVYVEYSSYTELCRGHECKNSIVSVYIRPCLTPQPCCRSPVIPSLSPSVTNTGEGSSTARPAAACVRRETCTWGSASLPNPKARSGAASTRSSRSSCVSHLVLHTFQVYAGGWGDLEGVIKCQMEEAHRYDLENQVEPRKKAAGFDKPSKGTSVEQFREMILDHLKVEVLSKSKMLKNVGFFLSKMLPFFERFSPLL